MNKFIYSLTNSFEFALEANRRKGYIRKVFNPYVRVYSLKIFVAQILFFVGAIFLFPLFPFFSRVNGLWVVGGKDRRVFFDCSDKSHALLNRFMNDGRGVTVVSTKKTDGNRHSLGLHGYWIYFGAAIEFFRVYGAHYWFYPALLQLPNLINLYVLLGKIRPDEVILTNHYDRWASIILHYCSESHSQSCLVQHGIEDETSIYPSRRFQKLSTLVAFNSQQAEVFRAKIFQTIESVRYSNPVIALSPAKMDLPTILVVGHGDREMFVEEIRVVTDLLLSSRVFIYIKPHPVAGKPDEYDLFDAKYVQIIKQKDFYPDVDFLLHSGSTLAMEYEKTSVKVKIYHLNEYKNIILYLDRI